MFDKVLIANRGEIALRIMGTCREMGISTVAVYSEADRDSLHVYQADEAYCIGPGPARESYLKIERVIDAAVRSGAQAIHPGYGFLSENPRFAEACESADIVFIGPSPSCLRLVGDKVAAKRLAESVGVPTVPGYHGHSQDDDLLLAEARKIGFPVLIKASFGGGGRGMRLVHQDARFLEAVEGARREAESAFGDGAIFVEKLLERPRHVEVQVLADKQGNLVHLGERDCSIQRRYQKVVEESPSPAVGEGLRRRLGEAALRVARAADYENAGTVEFLLDQDGSFYFLEVNPRLQVEHPVTEWVTGLDLVRLQLLVADGQELPLRQQDVVTRGHALEARVYAEDPAAGYQASSGRIVRFHLPTGPWIRCDAGIYENARVPVFYDSLLAKLVAFGVDRSSALRRLRLALEEARILGVTTNLPMLQTILADPEFVAGNTDTSFVQRRIEPQMGPQPEPPPEALLSATAFRLAKTGLLELKTPETAPAASDPWQAIGPWRLGRWGIEFGFQSGGRVFRATSSRRPGTSIWEIRIAGNVYDTEVKLRQDGRLELKQGESKWVAEVAEAQGTLIASWAGRAYSFTEPHASVPQKGLARTGKSEAGTVLSAPLPGVVVQIKVQKGDRVSARQTLVVLEAMKMEHLVAAPYAGVVKEVLCNQGQQVGKGATLVELERE